MFDVTTENVKKHVGAMQAVIGLMVMLMSAGSFAKEGKADEFVIKEAFVQHNESKLYTRQICASDNTAQRRQLVFAHGLTYSSHEFDVDVKDYSLARFFAKQGYCVWLFDVSGYGQSSKPNDGFVVDSDYAAKDLEAVVQHVRKSTEVEKVSLFGWSWGTVVSARMAIARPEWVQNMVLYAPIYYRLGSTPPKQAWHVNTWAHAASDFGQTDKGEIDFNLVDETVAAQFLANCWRFDGDSSPNGGRRDLLTSNGKAMFLMEKILPSVLLIGGSKDPLLNWPKLNEGFKTISGRKGNQLVKLDGGSHIMMLEKALYQEFRSHSVSFLNQTW